MSEKRQCIDCGRDLTVEDFLWFLNPPVRLDKPENNSNNFFVRNEFFIEVIFPKPFILFRCFECQDKLE